MKADKNIARACESINDSEMIISTRALTKRYGGFSVLSNISLQIRRGACTAICGKEGSGKTTLLRLLSLIENPTTGTLCFDGNEIHDNKTALLTMRYAAVKQEIEGLTEDTERIGMLHRELNEIAVRRFEQNRKEKALRKYLRKNKCELQKNAALVFCVFNMNPSATVFENMTISLAKRKIVTKQFAEERAAMLLEKYGYLDKRDVYPCYLNQLDYFCLSLLSALVRAPKLLLIDDVIFDNKEDKAAFFAFIKKIKPEVSSIVIAVQNSQLEECRSLEMFDDIITI